MAARRRLYSFTYTERGLTSVRCTGTAQLGLSACQPCSDLAYDTTVQRLEANACSDTLHLGPVNNEYLTYSQLERRQQHKRAQRDSDRLKLLELARSVGRLNSSLELHKRFELAVAEGNVPRLQQLVRTARRNGLGLARIIERLGAAMEVRCWCWLAAPVALYWELCALVGREV